MEANMAKAHVVGDHQIEIPFTGAVPSAAAPSAADFRLVPQKDPDIPVVIRQVSSAEGKLILTTEQKIDSKEAYQLTARDGTQWLLAPSLVGTLLTVLLTAALVQNFVFTR